jgi:hypothetical protein
MLCTETVIESAMDALFWAHGDDDNGVGLEAWYETETRAVFELVSAACEFVSQIGAAHSSRFGHDLYLTANSHGVGFWSGNWADILTQEQIDALCIACERFGGYDT